MEQDDFEAMIADGIRFLESLTRYYGAEKGMEVWEKLGEAVGQEVKGQVFFKLLSGGYSSRVRASAGTCTRGVEVIKAIRTYTGFGLKEAKDIWDNSKTSIVTIDTGNSDNARKLARELRDLGMIVT